MLTLDWGQQAFKETFGSPWSRHGAPSSYRVDAQTSRDHSRSFDTKPTQCHSWRHLCLEPGATRNTAQDSRSIRRRSYSPWRTQGGQEEIFVGWCWTHPAPARSWAQGLTPSSPFSAPSWSCQAHFQRCPCKISWNLKTFSIDSPWGRCL